MEENNIKNKIEDKFPEVKRIDILHYLLNKANVYYLPTNFDEKAFHNNINEYLQKDLSLKTDCLASDKLEVINYSPQKGVKSVLGLGYSMNMVMIIDDRKLFYDFKPDSWFKNPDKKESSFNLKKLVSESIEKDIDRWIHSYLFNLSLDGANSFIEPENRFIQNISYKQKLWLSINRNKEDILLAFLEVSAIKKWEKEYEENKSVKWFFLLSTNQAKLIGFSEREELIGHIDIKPNSIKVKKEIGRYPVSIGDIIFYTTRSNAGLYLDIYHLVSESANERIRETARLNWLNKDKKNKYDEFAIKLTTELNKRTENPFDDLSLLYMKYAEGKKEAVFNDFAEEDKLLKLLDDILNYTETIELLTAWVEKWKISYIDILAINKLLLEAIKNATQAKNILPFHKLVRDKYQKKNKDAINAVIFDYEYARHLIKSEQEDEAKKILNKRLKQLPDESISDLLPPKDLDLTGNAAGQILKVKILEVLADLEPEKKALEIKIQLASLQPLVESRIENLIQDLDTKTTKKASELKAVMQAEGLKFSETEPNNEKYKQLSEKMIEKNLRHPASRKGGSFSNIQKWLAKVEVPDYSMIKSYSEQLTEKKHPFLNVIVTDIKYALNIDNLEVYISRGDKSVGISGFEGTPSYLIVGGDHLDKKSAHYMGFKELKFAIAVEMAHLYFKHSRITSTDIWRGAVEKGYWVIDTALTIIPIAGLFGKSLQGISKLNTISSVLQKANNLDGISQNSKGIISATSQAVEVYNSKISKEKDTDKEKQIMATSRVMQLTADRAALIFTGELNATIRAMFLVSKRYYSELPVVEKYGLREFLLKKNDDDSFQHQDFAIRLANLFAFYLSDEYDNVVNVLNKS